jgi:predicted lipid carrier protein YhbT
MRGLAERGRAMRRLRPLGRALGDRLPVGLLQPILDRIVRRMMERHPDVLTRMGDKAGASILVDPVDLPFRLVIRPNPAAPRALIVSRAAKVAADASISATFMTLLQTIDARADGDALFFSRALKIGGDTEAVVRLRHAIDDIDGSVAADVAALHGPLGVAVLDYLRRRGEATA